MDKTLSCGLKDPGSIPGRGSLFYTTHAHSVKGQSKLSHKGQRTFRDSYINNPWPYGLPGCTAHAQWLKWKSTLSHMGKQTCHDPNIRLIWRCSLVTRVNTFLGRHLEYVN